mmetsp:Transcript_46290/g.91681  ORF Transcript_46290/g.91681 Transcript_46290/m.91681 type:complete len:569 (+) Transcript_46290:1-1707(+)
MAGGDMPMNDDEGSDMEGFQAPPLLPEGITKDIVTAAADSEWKQPKNGDEVTVHYVGTLAQDGFEFDSSRSRGQPFVFTLGKGQVIKGWDLGVATMKKGEVAKFTLAPEFAYGEAGSPPKIPANATLVFEVELIGWSSKDDLFGDDGVIKTILTEGSGWKKPKAGDEVLLSLKAVAADGSEIEERGEFEYALGSEALGPIAKAASKALESMKKGETAEIKCSKEYAYGDKHPDGATVTLSLREIYETSDVSFSKDGSVQKKLVKAGEGYDSPKDGAKVKLSVISATDGTTAIDGLKVGTLEFAAEDGEVCDALECAVVEMKKGERAVLTITKPELIREQKLGLQDVKADKVVLTVELEEFEKGKDTWSMSEDEKLEWAVSRKDRGSELLKAGRLAMALRRYKKVVDSFGYLDDMQEENKAKAKALKLACEANTVVVHLKLKDFVAAKAACNSVLKEDKQNIKALYRRAQAELGLKNFLECIGDCKKVVELDSQNKEARALLRQAQLAQREEDKKAKGLFANMCKALGRGAGPAPEKRQCLEGAEDGAGVAAEVAAAEPTEAEAVPMEE